MLQDVENDHVTIYPTFGASGVTRYHSGIRGLRTNGSADRISVVCSVYDSIEAAGSFPSRVSSHEVPVPETDTWPQKWLVEILRLTYYNKQRFVNFDDRLRAAARTSIASVGFNQEARPGRVEDSRFPDAVVLLKNGVHLITEDHIRSEVRRFLADQAVPKLAQGKTMVKTRLSSEIIGKSLRRLPFTTAKGYLVMTSEHVKRGDVIALIKGSQVPFVLRRRTSGMYQLISEAYVDGIMDGEAAAISKFGLLELA
ncbi:hypothetical protein LTR70_010423 [Exophiala xenobiotica]|uniref:DNA-directed RNA polymerase n=1 Tax=Lithohypha guttulata TaxID=1690604 RepID=A0ABR0JU05_9EURO|nr:hypothetical protein LTR24_010397 [Lithohypha guttulata]KAK5309279.1 hypothetical protein LTR70_010423 [Exophiala xenobiotica]